MAVGHMNPQSPEVTITSSVPSVKESPHAQGEVISLQTCGPRYMLQTLHHVDLQYDATLHDARGPAICDICYLVSVWIEVCFLE
jgi:hypothetical protein